MRANLTQRDYEQLSAYIDGQLSSGEKKRLEERIRSQVELQVALDELNRMRSLMKMAPRRKAPRNFTLTPEMAASARPRKSNPWRGLFPTLSFASALAALALIASLVFEFGFGQNPSLATNQSDAGRQTGGEVTMQEAAPAAESPAAGSPQATQSAAMAAPASDSAAPPIINWSDPVRGMGGEGGGYAEKSGPPGVYAMPPRPAIGMGGGGDYGMGGDGSLILPPSAVDSLSTAQPQDLATPVQPDASIQGSGPILGVPLADAAGKIQVQSAYGAPLDATNNQSPASEAAATPSEPVEGPRSILGLPPLRAVQVLLAILAVGLAAAALLLRRRIR